MRLIVVTDIFGKTSCLEDLLGIISNRYESVEVVDPYENDEIDFKNENEAYEHFQKTIGLNGYIEKLYNCLGKNINNTENHLLGFSVGASAVWAVSGMLESGNKTKGTCFYGSQIRNLLQVQPKFEIDLYFPKKEPHFHVDEVMDVLIKKDGANCFKTNYLHGFMNRKSVNFDEQGCLKYCEILKNK